MSLRNISPRLFAGAMGRNVSGSLLVGTLRTLERGCGNSWFESHRWWLAGARVCEFPPGTVRTLEPTVSAGDCWVESI